MNQLRSRPFQKASWLFARCRIVLVMLLTLGMAVQAGTVAGQSASSAADPDGLSRADWAAIQALINPAQQAYVKASNTELADAFGNGVAVSGDTVVVGAFAEASGATGVNGDQSNNSAGSSG